jgi:4-amino-4-deoxy-L-arabinose transferase-like glycosyltransferase
MKNQPWQRYLVFALFAVAIYFPLFHHLNWEPVHNWDESLFAMRAGYMAEEGGYLPNYTHWIEDGPLHRSSKPPFTTWLQALSMKIFGLTEFALRLPIALCVLATILLFLVVSKKLLGDIRIGYCAGFVLATTDGYVKAHAARTGDQDAALAFYMLAGAFFFYQYIEATTDRQRRKWLALLTLTLIASALTKYVFGLFFLPAFLIYALYKKEFLNILKRGSTWLAGLVFTLAVGGWLALMEYRLPGFFERAFFYEMVDRYATVIEDHSAPWHYYFTKMWENRFMPWLYLLPVPLALFFIKKYRPYRDVTLLMFLCAAGLLLIVSFSQTKTVHYDIVAYPPLALLAGIGLYEVIKSGWAIGKEKNYWPLIVFFGFLYFAKPFLLAPYIKILDKTFMPELTHPTEKYGYLFRQLKNRKQPIKKFTLVHSGFDGQALFYAGVFNRKLDYDIKISMNPEQVKPGDTIMVCDERIIQYLFEKWELQGLASHDQCFLAAVLEPKKQETTGE